MRSLLHSTIWVAVLVLATGSAFADTAPVKMANGIGAAPSAWVHVPSIIRLDIRVSQDGPLAIIKYKEPLELAASVRPFAVAATPEPGSLLLFGTGLLGAAFCLWRRRRVTA